MTIAAAPLEVTSFVISALAKAVERAEGPKFVQKFLETQATGIDALTVMVDEDPTAAYAAYLTGLIVLAAIGPTATVVGAVEALTAAWTATLGAEVAGAAAAVTVDLLVLKGGESLYEGTRLALKTGFEVVGGMLSNTSSGIRIDVGTATSPNVALQGGGSAIELIGSSSTYVTLLNDGSSAVSFGGFGGVSGAGDAGFIVSDEITVSDTSSQSVIVSDSRIHSIVDSGTSATTIVIDPTVLVSPDGISPALTLTPDASTSEDIIIIRGVDPSSLTYQKTIDGDLLIFLPNNLGVPAIKINGQFANSGLPGFNKVNVEYGGQTFSKDVSNVTDFSYSSSEQLLVDIASGNASNPGNYIIMAAGLQNTAGTAGADVIYGNELNNGINGISANDVIYGGGGYDIFYVEPMNGVIAGRYYGGDDVDVFNAPISSDISGAYFSGIEQLRCGHLSTYIIAPHTLDSFQDVAFGTSIYYTGGVLQAKEPGTYDISNVLYNIALKGTSGRDTLMGRTNNAYNDILNGGDGNDYIDGRGGKDIVSGDAGDDTVVYYDAVGASMYGGDGFDTLIVPYGTVYDLNATGSQVTGNTSVREFERVIVAGPTAQILTGDANANTITGGAGDDTLDGLGGADSLSAGDGCDVVVYDPNDTLVDGGAGAGDLLVLNSGATVDLSAANQVAPTISGSHVVTGFESVDATGVGVGVSITGNAADNILMGGIGNDTLVGGDGNDVINGDAGADNISGGAGNDDIASGGGADVIDAGAGDDTVTYDASAVSIAGGAGNDTLILPYGVAYNLGNATSQVTGTATVTGFENVIVLPPSSQTITGTENADTLTGGASDDVIFGLGGNDIIDGTGGADTINAGAGDDKVTYDAADTTEDGGTGTDTLVLTGATAITANLANATDQVTGGGTTIGFENIDASAMTAAVTLTGDGNANALKGGSAADTIVGGVGADSLYGNAGNDTIHYDSADTTIDGGAGVDTLVLTGATAITANLANTADQVTGGSVTIGFENIDASAMTAATTLTGDAGANTLTGGSGVDTITGGAGIDSLYGNAGNDFLAYESENAVTDGGAGWDMLYVSEVGVQTINLGNTADQVEGGGITTGFEAVKAVWMTTSLTLTGTAGVNMFLSGSGNDFIDGAGSVDTIDAGAGDDIVIYDAADAKADGSTGVDTLVLTGATAITANLANTTDQVTGGGITVGFENIDASAMTAAATLTGDAGANTLKSGSAVDIIYGGDGNDTLVGNGGADSLYGDAGNDTITYDSADTTIDGGAGVDTLVLTGTAATTANLANATDQVTGGGTTIGFENIDASAMTATATLTGDAAANTLRGGSAADAIIGGGGADIIDAGAGDDTVTYDASAVSIAGGAGNDTLILPYGVAYNLGNTTNQVTGTTIVTGFENVIVLPPSSPTITGTENADMLTGGAGDDVIFGLGGNDVIDGAGGADTIDAGAGDDIVTYDAIDGTVNGGTGVDTLVLTGATAITANLANTADQVTGGGTTIGFENIDASAMTATATLTGDAGANTLKGGSGVDTITGGAGIDSLYGNAGNDFLAYESENAVTDGGAGWDMLYVSEAGVQTINLGNTADQVEGGGITTGFEAVKAVWMTTSLTLTGTAGVNMFLSGSGNDFIDGAGSVDTIDAGAGDDIVIYDAADAKSDGSTGVDTLVLTGATAITANLANTADQVTGGGITVGFENIDASAVTAAATLTGDGNANILKGGSATDTIVGGAGADSLYGNGGDDTIAYDAADTTEDGGAGVDTLVLTGATAITANLANTADQVTGGGTTIGFENIDASAMTVMATLTGDAAANILKGGSAGDTIIGNGGADVIDAGAGDDTVAYDASAASIDGGAGADTLVLTGATALTANLANIADQVTGGGTTIGFENIDASAVTATATLTGDAGANTLKGGSGVDTITGGAGIDSLYGNAGNDFLAYESENAVTDGGVGWDMLYVSESGVQTINLGNTADQVEGGGITTGFEAVKAVWMTTSLTLTGTAGVNMFLSGSGNDFIDGAGSVDTIDAGAGDDIVIYDAADAKSDGSTGVDTLVLTGATAITANLATTTDQVTGGGVTVGFENIDASAMTAAATLTGDAGANTLKGGSGADTLTGTAGSDVLYGGDGNDTINAVYTTSVYGGAGDDTISLNNIANDNGNAGTIDGGAGTDTLVNFGMNLSLFNISNIERLSAHYSNLYLTASQLAAVSTIDALDGNVTIQAQSTGTYDLSSKTVNGVFNITGTDGSDALIGDSHGQTLEGGNGSDILKGGLGADTLIGGNGDDTYQFSRGDGADTIVENIWMQGNKDVLDFISGVSHDQLWFSRNGLNLDVSVIGTTDKVTISDWYIDSICHVESIKANGMEVLDTQVANLVNAMASLTPPPMGQTTLTAAQHTALDATIAANWHAAA